MSSGATCRRAPTKSSTRNRLFKTPCGPGERDVRALRRQGHGLSLEAVCEGSFATRRLGNLAESNGEEENTLKLYGLVSSLRNPYT